MSTIQNLKNFIRHGKQARGGQHSPHADPTTNVSTVTAQQQRYNDYAPQPGQHAAVTEPVLGANQQVKDRHSGDNRGFSTAPADQKNQAARAEDVAAKVAGDKQQIHRKDNGDSKKQRKQEDQSVVERIVAEERASQGKLPRYPGLERWNLVEKMGDGAFSNVYRARDSLGQYDEVAIKVVRKYEMNSSQGDSVLHRAFKGDIKKPAENVEKSNILKEVQIMRKIDHPNIVKLVDFSEAKQYYYIILELCPGGELFHQIVRLTYFSEDLSRHVITQVAEALEYLHEEAGVVHRDIKPENLLFYPIPFIPTRNPKPRAPEDEDKADEGEFVKNQGSGGIGTIKIADFGLSKIIWDSQTMTPCGTVGYTAPEIVKDERYSKSVDMWALGCVLYTLLCGFPPFYDESIQVLTEKVARGQYTFLSPWWDDISKPAQDLVSHLLTVNPDKRYDIKQFLNHPWIRGTEEETHAAADAPPLATPLAVRQSAQAQQNQQLAPKAVDDNLNPPSWESPTPSRNRAMDFRSPGAVNLREVFDVGYAVHRQEEETKRRKNFPQGFRGATAMNAMNPLNEGEDDEVDEYNSSSMPYTDNSGAGALPAKVPKNAAGAAADVGGVEKQMRNTTLSAAAQSRNAHYSTTQQQRQPPAAREQKGYGQHSPAVAAAARKQVKQQGPFELSLDNATLLGRRGKKTEGSGLKTELVQ